jgi:putative PIN family toxin of toxin-antitoxin system
MKVVLDTNVLVAGLLNPYGTCGAVVRLVVSGGVRLCLDARIFCEYQEVLARPAFGFDQGHVKVLINFFKATGDWVGASPLAARLPDRDDEPFLEVALAAGADALVTGNLKHFPPRLRSGVRVLSPAALVELAQK